jgi:hypothetical protein
MSFWLLTVITLQFKAKLIQQRVKPCENTATKLHAQRLLRFELPLLAGDSLRFSAATPIILTRTRAFLNLPSGTCTFCKAAAAHPGFQHEMPMRFEA